MGEMVQNQVPYSNALEQTKEVLGDRLMSRAKRSAGQLDDVADALRRTSKELDQNVVAPYIEKAADEIHRVSEYVRTADPRDIRRNVEGFARREPLLFLGGAFALGMLGARFLKSSARHAEPPRRDEGAHRDQSTILPLAPPLGGA